MKNFKKTSIVITQFPTRIDSQNYKKGILEVLGKEYIPKRVKDVLKRTGLSTGLSSSRSQNTISKRQFLRAIKTLEENGLIKHKAGYAETVYRAAAGAVAFHKKKELYLKRRKHEYMIEEQNKVAEKELLDKKRKSILQTRLSRTSSNARSVLYERAVDFKGAERAQMLEERGSLSRKEKRKMLSRIAQTSDQNAGRTSALGVSAPRRWSSSGSQWEKKKTA